MATKTSLPNTGAKSDRISSLAKKIKQLSARAQKHFDTEPISRIRVMRKDDPPSNNCSCNCGRS